ncbi:peptide ABC transporter substrate-binding protein [Acuticoccus mangrovi]|uniref:Peptide ABC transporter substrate-binding protein n=1 Tax=Acuticoccus mangrovi TaxID=2796142 RepID=A0A934IMD3_9HYPH|nr:peptide ABC transporter substrate-binding protein [Acuticoccus mangrovi]MBJ3775086.1 peptide ABC transporter substrate-binding protein [Acuticoccus mangrovi]
MLARFPRHATALAAVAFAVTIFTVVAATAPARAATYVRGEQGDPETLDPHKTSTVVEAAILRDLLEGLVINDAKAGIAPGVAKEWTLSDDGLTYTFTLRDDAKWSNGDPVTADDFVYSLRRIMTPETGAKYANILYPIRNAEAVNTGKLPPEELGVAAPDPSTVVITLGTPAPYFLELLTHQTGLPVHRGSIEAHGAAFVQPENMVTNGPYHLVSFAPNDKLVMEKSETFHDADEVAIDRVEYIPFEERATCLRRFEAGEVHSCAEVPREQIASIRERLGDEFHIAPYLGTYYYAINSARAPFDDPRIRRALSLAIDREFLAAEIFSGSMLAGYSLVPPGIANYVPEDEAPVLDYADTPMLDREDEALRLLEDAGYGPDKPLDIEISYNSSEDHRNAATAIAEMWRPLGINVTFNVRDLPAHYANLRDAKDYDVARAGWIGDYSDPQNFLFLNLSDNDGFNYGRYDNPEYDRLMAEAGEETDLAARAELLADAERLFLRDMPQIPLLHYSSTALVSSKLSGWEDNVRHVHPTRYLSLAD